MRPPAERLRAQRLVLITDGRGDRLRLERIVTAAVDAGLRAVQVREPQLDAAALGDLCDALRAILRPVDGMLIVNGRPDLVAAGRADGVHLAAAGQRVDEVRAQLGAAALIGASAHDAAEIAAATAQGADYVSLSPVFATTCKPGAPPLGLDRAVRLARDAKVPVVLLGGIDGSTIGDLRARWSGGVAVRSAICGADDPGRATAALLAAPAVTRASAAVRRAVRIDPAGVRRWAVRITLLLVLASALFAYWYFDLVKVPAGMDTLPFSHPPGAVLLLVAHPSRVQEGSLVLLELPEPVGGTLLSRVSSVAPDGSFHIRHDNRHSRYVALEELGPFTLADLRGTVFASSVPEPDDLPKFGK